MGGQEGGGKGASQARWRGRARAGPPPPDTARADIEGSAPGPCQAGSRSAHWRRRGPGPRCASVRPWRRRGVGRLGGGALRGPAPPPPRPRPDRPSSRAGGAAPGCGSSPAAARPGGAGLLAGGTRGAAALRSRQVGARRAAAAVAPLLASWAPALRASLLGTSTLRPRSLPRLGLGPPEPAGSPPEVSAPRARPATAHPASPLRPPSARRLRRSWWHGLRLPLPSLPRALSLPARGPRRLGGSALSGSRSRAPSFAACLGASSWRGPTLRGHASELGLPGPAALRASSGTRPPRWAPPSLQVFPQCLCPPSRASSFPGCSRLSVSRAVSRLPLCLWLCVCFSQVFSWASVSRRL